MAFLTRRNLILGAGGILGGTAEGLEQASGLGRRDARAVVTNSQGDVPGPRAGDGKVDPRFTGCRRSVLAGVVHQVEEDLLDDGHVGADL